LIEEDIRRRAITFVADVFRENEEVPEAHADFLRSLIEARLTASENAAKQGKPSPEWQAFGWFFAAKSLDDDWLLSQLERVLALTGGVIDPDFHVFERLPGIAQKQPERAVKCLRAIIEANREGWAVAGHEEEIRQVTQAALGAVMPARGRLPTISSTTLRLAGGFSLATFCLMGTERTLSLTVMRCIYGHR